MLEGNEINALKLKDEKNIEITFKYEIDGDKVILTTDREVKNPTIDFAQEKFYIVNLYNSNQIPAVPFEVVINVN